MANLRLRIFLSSPGDVVDERRAAQRVVARLQGEFGAAIALEPIVWEHEPIRATASFQDQIAQPSQSDALVCILWSRLGTRLPAHYRRADGSVYDSGTAYELETAKAAFEQAGRPDILVYRKTAAPLIDVSNRDERERRTRQWDQLADYLASWFQDPDGSFRAGFTQFERLDEFERLLETHLRRLVLERLAAAGVAAGPTEGARTWFRGSPFRGLQAFDTDHAEVFHGRTRAVAEAKARLQRRALEGTAFLMVTGMSGSGKSSLARAGLLPQLTVPGAVEGIGLWRRAVMRPGDAADPVHALAEALFAADALPELAGGDDPTPAELARRLRAADGQSLRPIQGALARAAQAVQAAERLPAPPQARLVVLVDQMEELVSRADLDGPTRDRFVAVLALLARSGLAWVVATLRSDFYHRCAEVAGLAELKDGAGTYDLLPPTGPEVAQMVRNPAMAAGLRFQKDPARGDLADVLQQAASSQPGSLPLLSFTLDELYKACAATAGVMTFAAYDALGGLEGAIARRAEDVVSALPGADQGALPELVRALVSIAPGQSAATARAVPRDAVGGDPGMARLVEALVEARLLVLSDGAGGALLRVAHEALLTRWPRAHALIEESRGFLETRARVQADAERWLAQGRPDDLLLPPGMRLAEAREVLLDRGGELGPGLLDYVRASVRAEEERAAAKAAAQRRKLRLTQAVAAGVAALALLSGVAAVEALRQGGLAREGAAQARAAQGTAEAARAQAEANQQAAEAARAEATREAQLARRETARAEDLAVEAKLAYASFLVRADPELALATMLHGLRQTLDNTGDVPRAREARAVFVAQEVAARLPGAALRGDVTLATLSPLGHQVAALGPDRRTLLLADTAGRARLLSVPLPRPAVALAYEPAGRSLLAVLADGAVQRVSDAGAPLVATAPGPGVTALAVMPLTGVVALGHADGTATLLRPDLGKARVLRLSGRPVTLLRGSPDGAWLHAADAGGSIRRAPVAGGAARQLTGPGAPVRGMDIGPDGRFLAVARQEGPPELLWARDGRHAFTLPTGDKAFASVAFTQDGRGLALLGPGGDWRVLDLPTRQWRTGGEGAVAVTAPARGAAQAPALLPVGAGVPGIDAAGRGVLWTDDWSGAAWRACALLAGSQRLAQPLTPEDQAARDTCAQLAWSVGEEPWLHGAAALAGGERLADQAWARAAGQVAPGGRGLLHLAALLDRADVLPVAAAGGTGGAQGLDRPDAAGETPLMLAARAGAVAALDWLLRHGADKEARDPDGRTALLLAAEAGQAGTVDRLLAAGAAVGARDLDGQSAASLADGWGFGALAARLRAAGSPEADQPRFASAWAGDYVVPPDALPVTLEGLALEKSGAPADLARAAALWQGASDRGDGFASYLLARAYRFGRGVPEDHDKSFALSRLSADRGSDYGRNELGSHHGEGLGVPVDEARALALYREVAATGNPRALSNLADYHRNGWGGLAPDPATARELYGRAAAAGNWYATAMLAEMLHLGEGGPPDQRRAFELFAAAAGSQAEAAFAMGHFHEQGLDALGLPRDAAKAEAFYRDGAGMGDPAAMFRLGRLLEQRAAGSQETLAEALLWYRRAAMRDDGAAALALGRLLGTGEGGVQPRPEEGLAWYVDADQLEARRAGSLLAHTLRRPLPHLARLDAVLARWDGAGRRVTRDGRGRVVREEDADGVRRLAYHRAHNRVETVVEVARAGEGRPRRTDFTYDGKGNLVRAARSDGRRLDVAYGPSGRMEALADGEGNRLRLAYAPDGGRPSTAVLEGVGSLSLTWDAFGAIDTAESPDGPAAAERIRRTLQDMLDLVKQAEVTP